VVSGSGSVPDAVDHLLHDASAHVAALLADATRLTTLVGGLRALTGAGGTGDELAVAAGPVTLSLDLAARTAHLLASVTPTPGGRGTVPWSADVQAGAGAPLHASVVLGGPGATAAGGLALRLVAGPGLQVSLERHRAGAAGAVVVPLWPAPDASGLAGLAARALPAEVARLALEYLRGFDATATAILDAALDAFGLLGPATSSGTRPVLLAAGLLEDPVGWFHHATALGSTRGGPPASSTPSSRSWAWAATPGSGCWRRASRSRPSTTAGHCAWAWPAASAAPDQPVPPTD
jgi:hypothetical protein